LTSLREELLAGRGELEARHPQVFHIPWARRLRVVAVVGLLAGLLVLGFVWLDISWWRVLTGFGELGHIVTLMLPPSFGTTGRLWIYLDALAQTLAIAFLGTLMAALLAFPFGFLAARNVVPVWLLRFPFRRAFEGIRGVDALIWALIWINVVGLGPFAGVLAIMTSEFGVFGKLFSEAIEAADSKPVEGVASAGGGRVHGVRFGLLPQVLPVMLSQFLYFFESNTRSATIIGIVGAGGIGLHLYEQIRTLEWQHVAFLVLMVLVTVAVIDAISARLRFAIIGRRTP
jgi:phosphonate transport system permease protein